MSNRPTRFAVCGLLAPIALTVLSGCYSYSPFGYRGYPEVMSTVPNPLIAPAGSLYPGQSLPPGVVPIGPQAATPRGVIGNNLTLPTLATPTPTGAPTGNPATTEPVPVYQDPTDAATGGAASESIEAGDAPAESSSSLRIPVDAASAETAGEVIQAAGQAKPTTPAGFVAPESPRRLDLAGTTSSPIVDGASAPVINESNYGYDAVGSTWFKGTVEYVKADGSWHLLYAPTPSQTDPYGGDISLADDPRLEALQHNDVVYVTGTIASGLVDWAGKPRFKIDQLSNITAGK